MMGIENIIGETITDIRHMSIEEMRAEGWEDSPYRQPPLIVLGNGMRIYPSCDDEGNGPGVFFGAIGTQTFYISVQGARHESQD